MSTLLGGKTITKSIEMYAIKYYRHVQRRDPTRLPKKALKMNSKKLKIGRPCCKLLTIIGNIMNKLGKDQTDWE